MSSTRPARPIEVAPVANPVYTAANGTFVLGLSRDGVTEFFGRESTTGQGTSNALVISSDGGATKTTAFTFPGPVTAVLECADGELLVSYGASSPGVIQKSTGWNAATPTAATWRTVYTSTGGYFRGQWGLHERCRDDNGLVIASEYGGQTLYPGQANGPTHVILSNDHGATWTTVFDLAQLNTKNLTDLAFTSGSTTVTSAAGAFTTNNTGQYLSSPANFQTTVTDAVFNGTATVTSATAGFSNTKHTGMPFVSAGNVPAGTTILAVVNSTTVTLSAPATTTASAQSATFSYFVQATYASPTTLTLSVAATATSSAQTGVLGYIVLHVHAVAYDRIWDRIWVSYGDTSVSGFLKIAYSDDRGVTFTQLDASAAGSLSAQTQYQVVTIVPLDSCILFGTDGFPNGLARLERTGYRQTGNMQSLLVVSGTGTLTLAYGAHRNVNVPITQRALTTIALINNAPAVGAYPTYALVLGTYDGYTFFTVYQDATEQTGGGVLDMVGPTRSGRMSGSSIDTGRFANGSNVVFDPPSLELPQPVGGTATFTGDGTTATFTITHGLGQVPRLFSVTPASANALAGATGGGFYVTASTTALTVTFTTPPAAAASVLVNWVAEA